MMLVKVCGMREPENIEKVAQLGVDMMGFIFYPKSPTILLSSDRVDQHGLQIQRMFAEWVSSVNDIQLLDDF